MRRAALGGQSVRFIYFASLISFIYGRIVDKRRNLLDSSGSSVVTRRLVSSGAPISWLLCAPPNGLGLSGWAAPPQPMVAMCASNGRMRQTAAESLETKNWCTQQGITCKQARALQICLALSLYPFPQTCARLLVSARQPTGAFVCNSGAGGESGGMCVC